MRLFHSLYWLLHTKRGKVIIAVVIISLVAVTVVAVSATKPKTNQPAQSSTRQATTPEPVKLYSPLTGREVADKAATTAPVTAVMIENSPDARPQSGLKDAGVVFEAIAEGGITRFAVLYQEAKPALIGPVRSVRPYYVSWIAPFDASIAHVGGSANALAEVRNGQYRDIDQFFNPDAYYRSTDRYAPHNVYTTNARLDELNASKGYTSSSFSGFTRVDPTLADAKKPQGAPAGTIAVSISGSLYNSTYSYDAASRTYLRSQAGAPHLDREGGQIAPSVVVVMKVPTVVAMEDGYREQMTVIGSGPVTIFQRGQVFEGTWNKGAQKDQLRFIGTDGKEIPLERGQTWVTAIPDDESVTWQ